MQVNTKISIRSKLIFCISLLIVIIGLFSCLIFFIHEKKEHEGALRKLGSSLVMLLARDSEVRLALDTGQYEFLKTSIKKIRAFDRENEMGYWRISKYQTAEKSGDTLRDVDLKEIPFYSDSKDPDIPVINRNVTSGGIFYDFSVPVLEKQIFSEEAFAGEYFGKKEDQQVLGIIQIGLSTHKLDEKLNTTILYSIIPTGLGTVIVGIFITIFLTRYIVSPLQRLASITQNISDGDFTRKIDISSEDEVGRLSTHFNRMTEALNISFGSLKQEIEEHKRTANDLRKSESKHRMLLENIPQRIFYKDKDSNYVSCNDNYAEDLKIKPDEIKGKTDYDLFPKEMAEKYWADDRRILDTGQTEEVEEQYITGEKELVIHAVKTPIKDEEGNIIGILGIFWDITEKVILQRETIRTKQLASLGELSAGVAHEINNPINGIINYAQLLFDESNEGSTEKDVTGRIVKEGNRIANIVNSLLSYARHDVVEEEKRDAVVNEILTETFVLMESQMVKEGIKIKRLIPETLSQIVANPHHIQQVFLNLLSNARHALNRKYPEAHDNKILEIVGEEIEIDNNSYVRVTFRDRGTGIAADILDKVLVPFFTVKPLGEGTGLGLSISHGIIKDHSGKLLVDSIKGEFTKISVVLPMSKKA